MIRSSSSPTITVKLPARKVKVSVNDQSVYWKRLSNVLFSDFFFTFQPKDNNNCINIVPEFIEESPEQVALMPIGSDPYLRPSLSIYVFDFSENDDNENVINWISQREMIGSSYLVIGLEKDKLFTKANQNINIGFDPLHFLLIQFKTRKRLSEKIIHTVRKIIQDHIVDDFIQCRNELENKIRNSQNATFFDRFRAYENLFLFSFGFVDKALNGYQELYNYLIEKDNILLKKLLKDELNIEQITTYPYTSSVEPSDVLLFSFYGLMSVYYQRTEWDNIISLFFKYFGFLRNKCQNDNDFESVSKWSIQAIQNLCSILNKSQRNEYTISLYILLFEIEYQIDFDLEVVYDILTKLKLPEHILSTINGRYLHWEKLHHKKLVDRAPINMVNWKLGSESIYIHFKNSLQERDDYKSINFGLHLLQDNSSLGSNKKLKVFNKLSTIILLDQSINLFQLEFKFQNKDFEQEFFARKPFLLNLQAIGAKWLTIELEKVTLIFSKESKTYYSTDCYKVKLNELIQFKCSFPSSGKWKIHKFVIQHQRLISQWLIKTDYNILCQPISNIEIQATIPKIISQNKTIPLSIEFNFLNIIGKSMYHLIHFTQNNIKIPNQITEATTDTGEIIHLEISENGKINYQDKIPFLSKMKGFIEIQIEKLTFFKSDLIIDTFIEDQKESTIKINISFIFPIIYNIRFSTNEIMHIQIQNISDQLLKIENDNLELTELYPNEDCYIIHPKNEQFLNLTIYDTFSNKISHQFNVQEKKTLPIIIQDQNHIFTNGEFISAQTRLPNCNYEFIPNDNCIITGTTKKNNFKEGILNFYITPIKVGIIEIPNIKVNNIEYIFEPRYLNVSCDNTLSYGPLF